MAVNPTVGGSGGIPKQAPAAGVWAQLTTCAALKKANVQVEVKIDATTALNETARIAVCPAGSVSPAVGDFTLPVVLEPGASFPFPLQMIGNGDVVLVQSTNGTATFGGTQNEER